MSEIDFSSLHEKSAAELFALGCRRWDDPDADGNVLWLFPKDWYDHIPAGMEVVDIFGEREKFEPGVTDDDYRAGVLAFGVLRHQEAIDPPEVSAPDNAPKPVD